MKKEKLDIIKDILYESHLETDLEPGKKVYVRGYDGDIVLEFWEQRQDGADDVDWDMTFSYKLK